MNEWIWLSGLFVVVAGLCFVSMQGLSRRRERVRQRLGTAETDSTAELVLGDMTSALAETGPMSESAQAELTRELRDAGYYRPTALLEYRAVRALLVLIPLFATGAIALLVDQPYMPVVAGVGLAVAGLGFSLPRVWLNYRGRVRARRIERGLPVAVDLLTLGLTAGQNILIAMHRVSREIRPAYPELSEELQIVARQADLRSLQHALEQLADRVRIPEVRTLALILAQSERLGTDAASALLEFSTNFRTTLRQRADAYANRASFWMIFPTLFCMWIPAAALIVGPIFYEFWYRRAHIKDMMTRRQSLQELVDKSRNINPPEKTGESLPGQ
jgi:tight adherence protein C